MKDNKENNSNNESKNDLTNNINNISIVNNIISNSDIKNTNINNDADIINQIKNFEKKIEQIRERLLEIKFLRIFDKNTKNTKITKSNVYIIIPNVTQNYKIFYMSNLNLTCKIKLLSSWVKSIETAYTTNKNSNNLYNKKLIQHLEKSINVCTNAIKYLKDILNLK